VEEFIRDFEQLKMRIGLDKRPMLKSYMTESPHKAPIQMDSTLVPFFEAIMDVQVQF